MKEKYKKIKELWANKRYRALIILGLYLVFFIFVFSIIGQTKSIPKPINNLDTFKNANYQYTINNEIKVSQDMTIVYQGNVYTKDDFPLYNFDINPLKIYNLIKQGILESTNHIEKSDTYLVNGDVYQVLEKPTGNIHITVYEDAKINRVIVDFSDYYGYPYVIDLEVL